MAFHRYTCFVMCAFLVGCGDDSRPSGDTGPRVDTTVTDAGRDAPMGCATDPDCDDGHECTIDMCGVGNVCRYTPLDERCEDGEMCLLGAGCASGCETSDDCDDGDFCNGPERCIMTPTGGECFDSLDPADCNDGNMCTIDSCSTEVNGCVYETAEGCDAGPVGGDASMPDPFDPEVHYEGTFLVAPAQNLVCPSYSFGFDRVVITNSGGTLSIATVGTPAPGPFTLSQTPTPTGDTFAANGNGSGCSSVQLTATFMNSDQFMGTWIHNCCETTSVPMFGQRL